MFPVTGLYIGALVIIQIVIKSNYNIMQKPDCYQTNILHRLEEKWIIMTQIIEVAIHSVHPYNPFDSSKGRTDHVGEKDRSQEILSLRDQLLHLWQVEGAAAGISDWHTTNSTGWLSSGWERKIGWIFLLQTFPASLCQNKEQECLQNRRRTDYLCICKIGLYFFFQNAQENRLSLHRKKEKQVLLSCCPAQSAGQNTWNCYTKTEQKQPKTGKLYNSTLNKETEFEWSSVVVPTQYTSEVIRIAHFHPLQMWGKKWYNWTYTYPGLMNQTVSSISIPKIVMKTKDTTRRYII